MALTFAGMNHYMRQMLLRIQGRYKAEVRKRDETPWYMDSLAKEQLNEVIAILEQSIAMKIVHPKPTTMTKLEELTKEALSRGIVPGAKIKCALMPERFGTVMPRAKWHADTEALIVGIDNVGGELFAISTIARRWATVIKPAPGHELPFLTDKAVAAGILPGSEIKCANNGVLGTVAPFREWEIMRHMDAVNLRVGRDSVGANLYAIWEDRVAEVMASECQHFPVQSVNTKYVYGYETYTAPAGGKPSNWSQPVVGLQHRDAIEAPIDMIVAVNARAMESGSPTTLGPART